MSGRSEELQASIDPSEILSAPRQSLPQIRSALQQLHKRGKIVLTGELHESMEFLAPEGGETEDVASVERFYMAPPMEYPASFRRFFGEELYAELRKQKFCDEGFSTYDGFVREPHGSALGEMTYVDKIGDTITHTVRTFEGDEGALAETEVLDAIDDKTYARPVVRLIKVMLFETAAIAGFEFEEMQRRLSK